jgi:hypothetical protein
MMNWQLLNLQAIPKISGVYGFQHHEQWLYIGKAKNLANRLTKHHPALSVALSLALPIRYWYQPSDAPSRLESQLIRELRPEWNGGTSYEEMSEHHLYAAYGCFCNVELNNQNQCLIGLKELATLHPERLKHFDQAVQNKIMNCRPLWRFAKVSAEQMKEAIAKL